MKNKPFLLGTAMVILLLSISSCKKDVIINTQTLIESNNLISKSANKPLVVYAGGDFTLQLPLNSAYLNGSYSPQYKVTKIEWKKLSGPGSEIENPNSLRAKVNSLKVGEYLFELTITDSANQFAKDSVKINVIDRTNVTPGSTTVTFKQLAWVFPWYNSLEVLNIHSFVPLGASMKVYVQRGFNADWIEAFPVSGTANNNVYEYFIETRPDGAGIYTYGSLYVFYYGNDVSDKPNIKVTY